jgi:hypothetical protein
LLAGAGSGGPAFDLHPLFSHPNNELVISTEAVRASANSEVEKSASSHRFSHAESTAMQRAVNVAEKVIVFALRRERRALALRKPRRIRGALAPGLSFHKRQIIVSAACLATEIGFFSSTLLPLELKTKTSTPAAQSEDHRHSEYSRS